MDAEPEGGLPDGNENRPRRWLRAVLLCLWRGYFTSVHWPGTRAEMVSSYIASQLTAGR